jgi:orotate phosphoribosyltransferase
VVDALKQAELQVLWMVCIFTYEFALSRDAFAAAGIPYYSLTNYPTLISLAIERGIVGSQEEEILLKWKDNPSAWTGF